MKKFKQFKSEQQHIAEMGPYATAFAGAMGLLGLGLGGYKLFKKIKKGIKGYRETKAEKKDNKEAGVYVKIKTWDDSKGKTVDKTVEIAAPGSSAARMSNEDIEKKRKELQKKQDPKNTAAQNAYDTAEQEAEDERGGIEDVSDAEAAYKNSNKDEKLRKAPAGWKNVGTKQQPQLMKTRDAEKELARRKKVGDPDLDQMQKDADDADTKAKAEKRKEQEKFGDAEMKARAEKEKKEKEEAEKKKKEEEDAAKKKEKEDAEAKAREKRGGIEDPKDAEEFFKNNKKAPKGWQDVRTKSERDPKHKNFKDFKGSILTTADAKKFKERKARLKKGAQKDPKKLDVKSQEQTILSFGEFISEGVMDDLKKASKSRKDSEITLDDGADIPIDPLTSQILVKYIEGLSSSEKNRTIQQIQRTERAFMKVLGKAHEG